MRHLLAVREHGSFAKAAEVLQMSQPSLSASISRLEDRLKVKLFDRSAAGSVITQVGEFIADRASRVIAEVDGVTRAAALVSGGNTGTIRIGWGAGLKDTFMERLIVDLATAKPALNLSLHVDVADNLLSLLRAREIDIAICAVASPELGKDLIVSEIFTAPPVVVASPSHPLANERPLSIKRFLEFPVAGLKIKVLARSVLRMADDDSITRYDANDYDALMPLALNGLATLIAPDFVARPHIESGALVELGVEFLFPIPYAAVTNEVNSFSPIVKEIIRRAQEAGNSFRSEMACLGGGNSLADRLRQS
jgi:DNA-binding transcriptional LysR family regulator